MRTARAATGLTLARVLIRGGSLAMVLGLAGYFLRDRLPDPGAVLDALGGADVVWLAAAGAAMFVSINMFAHHQRGLLTAIGIRMRHRRALALSYCRSAIAYGLPAGSAVSAAYAYRHYRARGADRHMAATIVVVSGALLTAALAGLCILGVVAAALSGHPLPLAVHPVVAVAGAACLTVGGVLLVRRTARSVAPRCWLIALTAAMANWLAELLCLHFSTRALGLDLDPIHLGAVFLAAQLARQVPFTPGGIGLIEATLLTGLVAAGAATTPAAAAVLIYRCLSCWITLPIGFLSWLSLRKPARDDFAGPERTRGRARAGRGLTTSCAGATSR